MDKQSGVLITPEDLSHKAFKFLFVVSAAEEKSQKEALKAVLERVAELAHEDVERRLEAGEAEKEALTNGRGA